MQKPQDVFLQDRISVSAGIRTFLPSLGSSPKMGLALNGSDEIIPNLSTLCSEGEAEGWWSVGRVGEEQSFLTRGNYHLSRQSCEAHSSGLRIVGCEVTRWP